MRVLGLLDMTCDDKTPQRAYMHSQEISRGGHTRQDGMPCGCSACEHGGVQDAELQTLTQVVDWRGRVELFSSETSRGS